jgi:hypothetical protein
MRFLIGMPASHSISRQPFLAVNYRSAFRDNITGRTLAPLCFGVGSQRNNLSQEDGMLVKAGIAHVADVPDGGFVPYRGTQYQSIIDTLPMSSAFYPYRTWRKGPLVGDEVCFV